MFPYEEENLEVIFETGIEHQVLLFHSTEHEVGAEVQADCMCIVYLRVPVCVIKGGGGASSTPTLKAPPWFQFKSSQLTEEREFNHVKRKTCFQLETWFLSELST